MPLSSHLIARGADAEAALSRWLRRGGLPFLRRLLRGASCLSLDVFDTALVRLVAQPVDVFTLIAQQAGIDPPEPFALARVRAEREARAWSLRERGHAEVTLAEIYEQLTREPGWPAALPKTMMDAEVAAERRLSRRNPLVHAVYRSAKEAGIPTVFVSDMYLPEALVRALLDAAGYEGRLFLSSALSGPNKHEGKVYPLVCAALGVAPKQVLHLGDNRHADVRMARRAGLRAYPTWPAPATWGRPVKAAGLFGSLRAGLLHERDLRKAAGEQDGIAATAPALPVPAALAPPEPLPTLEDDDAAFFLRFGYEIGGPLYLGFVQWLGEELTRDGVDQVFFLARDGLVLQQVYERLREVGWLPKAAPPATYLPASRRALGVPALTVMDDEALRFVADTGQSRFTVAQLLERCGLAGEVDGAQRGAAPVIGQRRLAEACWEAGVALDEPVHSYHDQARLRRLFESLSGELLAVAAAERGRALRYFEQVGLLGARRPAVIDVGWNGTLQRYLQRILRTKDAGAEVRGYYQGLFARPSERRITARGYLFAGEDRGPEWRRRLDVLCCVELIEFLHTAPHGSITGYAEGPGGAITATAGARQRLPWQLRRGELAQRGGLAFVDDLLALVERPVPIPAAAAFAPLRRVLRSPTGEEARRLGELQHVDTHGDLAPLRYLARPLPRGELTNPRRLWADAQDAYWRQGYLRRLLGPVTPLNRAVLGGARALQILAGRLRGK